MPFDAVLDLSPVDALPAVAVGVPLVLADCESIECFPGDGGTPSLTDGWFLPRFRLEGFLTPATSGGEATEAPAWNNDAVPIEDDVRLRVLDVAELFFELPLGAATIFERALGLALAFAFAGTGLRPATLLLACDGFMAAVAAAVRATAIANGLFTGSCGGNSRLRTSRVCPKTVGGEIRHSNIEV